MINIQKVGPEKAFAFASFHTSECDSEAEAGSADIQGVLRCTSRFTLGQDSP